MADEKVLITESTLDNIGEAIREKNGETDLYYPREMPAAIRRIRTGEGGGSIVAVYPILVEGEHIADIVVDGERYNIYAPEQITYVAGDGIEISGTSVSVSESLRRVIAGKVDTDALETIVTNLNATIASKQDVLVAGQNITIQGNTISATGGGTDVEANPTGTPTDELNSIQINDTIYEIVGGGGGGGDSEFKAEVLYDGTGVTSLQATISLSKGWDKFDAIYCTGIEYYNNREYQHTHGIVLKSTLQSALDSTSVNGGWIDLVGIGGVYAFAQVVSTSQFTNVYGSNVHHIDKIYGLTFGGGSSGGGEYSETVLYTASASAATYTLSESYKNFDAIEVIGTYYDSWSGKQLYFTNTYPVSELTAHEGTTDSFGLCNDSQYTYFAVTNETTFTRTIEQSIYVCKIQGLKFGGSGGGTEVIANPEGEATDRLTKIQIGDNIYEIVGGGGGSSDDYSTTEQVVGTWIDGKPIYKKTFEVNFHTNGLVWVDTGCVIDNIGIIVDYDITANDTYVGGAPANCKIASFRYNNSNIQMYVNSSWYLDVHTITVEYTKTTD